MRTCFCLFILFIPAILFSQPGKVSIASAPSWITHPTNIPDPAPLEKFAEDGYIILSYERQVNVAEQNEYINYSKKILSQAGVQNESQISVSFDPSYEQVIFHAVNIIRNGERLNRLQLSKIKKIQQEKELADFIYNGVLDAILILDDVRPGDVIEYSYSRKGFNPVFKNKYTDDFNLEFSIPICQVYYKLISPAGRNMNIKNLNHNTVPKETIVNGQHVYEWYKKDVPPLVLQDYTPSWFDPYARIMVSEFNSWKEVNDWALALFPGTTNLSPAVMKKIKEIEGNYKSDEERTKAALQFVQDDIRYMGIEMGENSHKPASPSKVFAQRYGDCKEKSYLLSCMLNAMNITSNVVLLNTGVKDQLYGMLPAPTNFDHATVRVILKGRNYWFDPTISFQRGDLKNIYFPDYQLGLVVTDTTSGLTRIDYSNSSYVHVKNYFRIASMDGNATLMVTTSYSGYAADNQRENFKNESIVELMKDYEKFYAATYDRIRIDSLTYSDDERTGVFTTQEYYHLSNPWSSGKDNSKKFTFASFIIDDIIRRPKDKERKMPIRLAFPAKYREESIVELPENWQVAESESHIRNSSYAYNSKIYSIGNKVFLKADYENFKDYIATTDASQYFDDINAYDENATYILSTGGISNKEVTSNTGSRNIFSTLMFVGAIAGGMVWWIKRK
jgi:transglutaminase-like putative cysteine protease